MTKTLLSHSRVKIFSNPGKYGAFANSAAFSRGCYLIESQTISRSFFSQTMSHMPLSDSCLESCIETSVIRWLQESNSLHLILCALAAAFTNSRGTCVEIWRRIVYTVRVAFEVMVFICIGVCYPKLSLNCNTIASHSPNEWDANGKQK